MTTKTVDGAEPVAPRPGGHDAPARAGQSGEGARSALEQLLRQEQKRNAQRPREAGEQDAPPGPAP